MNALCCPAVPLTTRPAPASFAARPYPRRALAAAAAAASASPSTSTRGRCGRTGATRGRGSRAAATEPGLGPAARTIVWWTLNMSPACSQAGGCTLHVHVPIAHAATALPADRSGTGRGRLPAKTFLAFHWRLAPFPTTRYCKVLAGVLTPLCPRAPARARAGCSWSTPARWRWAACGRSSPPARTCCS